MKPQAIQGKGQGQSAGTWDEVHPRGTSPATPVVQLTIEVTDPSGLHMRSASRIAETAREYQADIWIRHRDIRQDAKSILDVLMTAAVCGTRLQLEATGPDAEGALRALSTLDTICKAV